MQMSTGCCCTVTSGRKRTPLKVKAHEVAVEHLHLACPGRTPSLLRACASSLCAVSTGPGVDGCNLKRQCVHAPRRDDTPFVQHLSLCAQQALRASDSPVAQLAAAPKLGRSAVSIQCLVQNSLSRVSTSLRSDARNMHKFETKKDWRGHSKRKPSPSEDNDLNSATSDQHSLPHSQMRVHTQHKPFTSQRPRCCAIRADLNALPSGAASSSTHGSSRRELLAGTAAVLTCGLPSLKAVAAAAEPAAQNAGLAAVPQVALTPQLQVSQVIKGCWQLSGGHKGDRQTDRTAAATAVQVIHHLTISWLSYPAITSTVSNVARSCSSGRAC
jgi:hypothetical protein